MNERAAIDKKQLNQGHIQITYERPDFNDLDVLAHRSKKAALEQID